MTQSVKDLVTKAYNLSSIPPNPLCSLISTGAHMCACKIHSYNKKYVKKKFF